MPTYEYACTACGHEWEQTQRITEPAIEVCPVCAKSAAHRLISAGTNFILKGSGWYSDLYSSPKPPADKSEKKDTAETKDGSEKKGEKSGTSAPTGPESATKSPAKPVATESASTDSSSTSSTPSVPST
jgi:putative FmdB family regulatory protein